MPFISGLDGKRSYQELILPEGKELQSLSELALEFLQTFSTKAENAPAQQKKVHTQSMKFIHGN